MQTLGTFVFYFGVVILLAGAVWFLYAAFCENILWGLGCMFVPFVALLFLVLHFNKAALPFLTQAVGFLFAFAGVALGGGGGGRVPFH